MRKIVGWLPLTGLGALVAAAALTGLWQLGQKRQDLVIYVAGLGAVGLVAVCVLSVSVTAVVVAARWKQVLRPEERAEAGQPSPTGFSLPALSWLPLVSLRWTWAEPERVELAIRPSRGRLREEVTYRERGEHVRTVRRVLVEDSFGLARIAVTLVEPCTRTVLPARGRPPTAPLLRALAGGDAVSHPAGPPDGDLIEMRRYAPGDPMKRILWKTFARSRNLMVRLPERAIAPTHRTLAFLVAGEGDEPPAALARLALESQALGPDWRFGADGSQGEAKRLVDALPLIVKSRAARGSGGDGLGPFLERSPDAHSARCVLFVPPRPGRWLGPVEREVKRRGGSVEVVVGVDGVREAERRPRWRRPAVWLLSDDDRAADAAHPDELERVCRALAAAGARVTVIDRPSGKVYGRTALRRAS